MKRQKVKFIDSLHENTEDTFELERDSKGRTFIYVNQEFDSGNVYRIILSPKDVEQIQKAIKELD